MKDTVQKAIDAEMLEKAEIPEAFWKFDLDGYAGSPSALREVDLYCKRHTDVLRKTTGLFIRGGADSQKTFLAVYALKYLMSFGHSAKYISMPDLVDKVMANDIRLRDYLKVPDFVVIDNLSADTNTFYPTALNRALTARRDFAKPTICVTQLEAPQGQQRGQDPFAAVYGDPNLRLIQSLSHTVHAHIDSTKHQQMIQARKDIFVEEAE